MVSLTLSVDSDLKSRMDAFPEMNWSAIARRAIIERVELMEKLKQYTKDSKLTDEDAIRLGKELKKSAAKKRGLT